MAELPDYIPKEVAAEYARLMDEFSSSQKERDRLNRLVFRPCMEKVYKALACKLSSPEAWNEFFSQAFVQTVVPDGWNSNFKPARDEFVKQRSRAISAGRELLAALQAMQEGEHGYHPPFELRSIYSLLSLPAGPIIEVKKQRDRARLYAVLAHAIAGTSTEPQSKTEEINGPSVLEAVAAIVRLAEEWTPGKFGDSFSEQTQGTKPKQVYVRAVDRVFHRICESGMYGFPSLDALPNGRLLSYDNLARLTRAALDIPDAYPGYPNRKTFNGEDVRRALETAPE